MNSVSLLLQYFIDSIFLSASIDDSLSLGQYIKLYIALINYWNDPKIYKYIISYLYTVYS